MPARQRHQILLIALVSLATALAIGWSGDSAQSATVSAAYQDASPYPAPYPPPEGQGRFSQLPLSLYLPNIGDGSR